MKVLIYLISVTILYKTGVISKFLDLFKLQEPQPATATRDSPQPVKVNPDYKNISRLELEQLAIDRMKNIGIKHWYIIARTAPNDVLIEWAEL